MRYIHIYISFFLPLVNLSQNLVPNPSFETYNWCPISGNNTAINSANPWMNGTNTSSVDYYNTCAGTNGFGIPNGGGGFQYPHSGNAYSGLVFLSEFLQVQLMTPLIQNKTYYIEFYVVLHSANWVSGSNNVAANLSVIKPVPTPTSTTVWYETLPITSHIMLLGNPIISDTLNWVKISGCYTAQGGEEYLTIGNFFDKNNTQTNGTGTSYFLVDDVKVEEFVGTCVTNINEFTNNVSIELYPNPMEGKLKLVSDDLKEMEHLTIKISDIVGKEILVSVYKDELDVSSLNKGIYFLSIYKEQTLLGTKKIIKQ